MLSVTHIMPILVLLSEVGVGMQQCMIRNHILLLQMSWIRVLQSHSCGGTLQKSRFKLLHSSMQMSADHRSRRRGATSLYDWWKRWDL